MCVEKIKIKTIDQITLPKNNIFLQMFCIFLEELESHCSMSVSNLGNLFLCVTTTAKGKKSAQQYVLNCKMSRAFVCLAVCNHRALKLLRSC